MIQKLTLFICLLMLSAIARAQSPADTMLQHSPVRTLTDQQYTAFLKGADIRDMGYVAELNHFPSPDHLLQYKKELDLSPSQVSAITGIIKQLQMKRLEVGTSVIRNERVLDSLFRTKRLDEGAVIFYGNRYGLYEGEYRTAVLMACYKTQKVLTERQIKKFEALQKHN